MRTNRNLTFALAACVSAACGPVSSGTSPGPTPGGAARGAGLEAGGDYFEFVMDGLDVSEDGTSVARLNQIAAGERGFVRVKQGHFVDGAGERLRFFGTNLTASACFPDKKDAEAVAKRLRKLGFNVIRFHFMDSGPAPYGLFAKDGTSFDSEQLDKLDFLIAALQKEGIYANLNLHVARRYPGIEGKAAERFPFGKVLDRFHEPFVELQKDYAKRLLTHKNPYTGRTYATDPGVAFVEINNENTIFPTWAGQPIDLPEPFRTDLTNQWQAWLRARYGGTAALRTAWNRDLVPSPPIVGPTFETGRWKGEDAARSAKLTVTGSGDGQLLRYEAKEAGKESWHLQFFRTDVELEEGAFYSLVFEARSDAADRKLDVTVMRNEPDWSQVGLSKQVVTGTSFTRHALSFHARGTVGDRHRINFSLANRPGFVELRRLTLQKGAPPEVGLGLAANQSLEKRNVPLPREGESSPEQYRDYIRFLRDTELRTSKALSTYLRQELGVKSLIADSQADYGGMAGILREAAISDFIDLHGYWQHPHFEGGGWNMKQWTIGNVSQVAATDGGTLGGIAANRIAGMPLTVSEYNTPAPNDHAAETFPLLAAIASFQDWDGVYPYTYLDFKTEWKADRILGFFDLNGHPGRLVFAPGAALAFRRGLVQVGRTPVTLSVPAEPDVPDPDMGALSRLWEQAGAHRRAVGMHRLEVRLDPKAKSANVSQAIETSAAKPSDTGELDWQFGQEPPRFLVQAPGFRLAAGKIGASAVKLSDVLVEVGEVASGYATVQLVALDEAPIAESRRVLLSVAARVENQGMGWNESRTSVSDQWGKGPTLAERVPLRITLPGSGWRAEPLDGSGKPIGELVAETGAGTTTFATLPNKPSLWFLLSR